MNHKKEIRRSIGTDEKENEEGGAEGDKYEKKYTYFSSPTYFFPFSTSFSSVLKEEVQRD